ncbi:MAG: alpha/beta hydrolase [Gemmatimonadetes bacterium]|nr:alpha/beta hydrolase [Gemmatimonadota bacterium]
MPGRTIGGWAHDVEALADSLGIDRFAVAGASGGGPYALAVARALPRRVTMAGLVSTAGEVVDRSILRRLDAGNRMKFGLPLIAPKVLRFDLALVGVLARIAPALLARGVAQLSASDRDLMQQGARRKALTSLLREAFHGGSLGVYSDMMLGSRPWDFDASEVRVPTYLWHGEHDAMAPFWMAQAVAKRIPSSDLKVLAGRGHLILGEPNVLDSLLGLVCAHA